MKISLYFKDFVIEKSSSCSRDYLLVYDGEDKNARLVGRYCHAKPVPFTSSSNYIHVQFVTDLSLGYRGFYATYNITSPTTGTSIFYAFEGVVMANESWRLNSVTMNTRL